MTPLSLLLPDRWFRPWPAVASRLSGAPTMALGSRWPFCSSQRQHLLGDCPACGVSNVCHVYLLTWEGRAGSRQRTGSRRSRGSSRRQSARWSAWTPSSPVARCARSSPTMGPPRPRHAPFPWPCVLGSRCRQICRRHADRGGGHELTAPPPQMAIQPAGSRSVLFAAEKRLQEQLKADATQKQRRNFQRGRTAPSVCPPPGLLAEWSCCTGAASTARLPVLRQHLPALCRPGHLLMPVVRPAEGWQRGAHPAALQGGHAPAARVCRRPRQRPQQRGAGQPACTVSRRPTLPLEQTLSFDKAQTYRASGTVWSCHTRRGLSEASGPARQALRLPAVSSARRGRLCPAGPAEHLCPAELGVVQLACAQTVELSRTGGPQARGSR